MLILCSISNWSKEWKELPEADYAALRAKIPALPAKHADYYGQKVCVDEDGMELLARHKFEIHLEKGPDDSLMLVRLQDRIKALELRKDDTAAQLTSGAAVHVHIPDHALTHVTEVIYLECACTEELQGRLDEGWRLLAVCPPNAARRPDYILGRRKDQFL